MNYKTSGVCSREINFDIENGIIKNVTFSGGCAGNTAGISNLVVGMPVDEVIKRLEGVTCGPRKTSCPDQLAKALKEYEAAHAQ
ncbi:TIGR03905 family TSCPD domain-containing protein [Anaeromicropila herbilytica]|uniref:ribonucleoside-diphosphate reductase n=1 Tax=Anaeromicropila herbilytica TaxID=2785025 RepID=A0A7R7EPZ0_9FIRM|nr:TIGR03905 family TSCPD domain-containing protein [Anaeromicropila herbilytica]BCN32920.1 TSCPD domain-containing protein [Anaeromicropila herbilytica]